MNIELGKFLAKLRQEKGITQEKLSEMLNIDKRKISRWETGSSTPEFDMLIKLSEIFDISLYELSICKRIPDKNILETFKTKFITPADYKKYTVKKRIINILTLILGLLLGLSAIFTLNNYNKTFIYSLYSVDENYQIAGNYIQTPKYDAINIGFVKDTVNKKTYIDADNIYEICDDNRHILIRFITSAQNDIYEKSTRLSENETYYLKIYYNKNDEGKELLIPFKVTIKYSNSFLFKTSIINTISKKETNFS